MRRYAVAASVEASALDSCFRDCGVCVFSIKQIAADAFVMNDAEAAGIFRKLPDFSIGVAVSDVLLTIFHAATETGSLPGAPAALQVGFDVLADSGYVIFSAHVVILFHLTFTINIRQSAREVKQKILLSVIVTLRIPLRSPKKRYFCLTMKYFRTTFPKSPRAKGKDAECGKASSQILKAARD